MQVTRPNEIQRPGVRLHPKACAALGLEAERATPKRLGTLVPRTCMHAPGTGYARKSGEPLGFRPKEGTCASTGAHPPGETSTSRWRRSPLPVLPGAALLAEIESFYAQLARLNLSATELIMASKKQLIPTIACRLLANPLTDRQLVLLQNKMWSNLARYYR